MTTPISGVTGYSPMTAATGTLPAGSTAATDAASGSDASSTQSLLDPQAFLQLLVAQLKYQDPTNPTDTSTFMNQTAMLSQVQTMNSMSTTLSALAQSQQAQSATDMIGKQVTYLDANGMRVSGLVGSASLSGTTATLQVGGTSVPLTSVVEVAAAPAT
jgi:flagellar basal-body rod modification protein FlgD